jgi:sugar phosphate permease
MSDQQTQRSTEPTVLVTLRYLWNKRSFRHLAAGAALVSFVVYGVLTWVPAFLMRSHEMGTGEVGTYLGFIFGIAGSIGIFAGGYLGDVIGRGRLNWNLWLVCGAQLLAFPFLLLTYSVNSAGLAMLSLAFSVVLGYSFSAPTFAHTQNLSPVQMRSVAASVMLFVMNIIGLGLAPQVVGWLSDGMREVHGDESLRFGLLYSTFVLPWAAWHYYRAGRLLIDDLAEPEFDENSGGGAGVRESSRTLEKRL